MVSLKSFKTINEAEKDEVITTSTTNSEINASHPASPYHHPMSGSGPPFYTNTNLVIEENNHSNFSNMASTTNVNESHRQAHLQPNGGSYQIIGGSREDQLKLQLPEMNDSRLSVVTDGQHFEIVWSNLSYKIEPKWYKKINFLDKIFSHILPGQTVDTHSSATSTASSSVGINDNQQQIHNSSANATDTQLNSNLNDKQKSSLDPIEIFTNLNGTIKSGQMTAVLGPSGKCRS